MSNAKLPKTDIVERTEDAGKAFIQLCKYDDAIAQFDEVLKVDPKRKRSLKGKIVALRKLQRWEKSSALADEALALYPRDPYFSVELGWLALETNEFKTAIECFDQTLDEDPNNEGALQGKAAALRKNRNFHAAEDLLDDAVAKHSNSLGILAERGWLWWEQGDYSKAAKAFEAALKVPQRDDSIYVLQLSLLRKIGRIDDADAVLRKALEHFPESLRLKTEAAWQLFYHRDYSEATKQFSTIIAIDPTIATALQGKVASLRLAGALDDAEGELEAHSAVVASDAGLKAEQAWIAFAREDYATAVCAFREILDRFGGNDLDRINLAWALVKKGDKDLLGEAAQLCRDALSERETVEALGCLGVVSFKRGKIDDAESYLRKSIRNNALLGHQADLAALYTYLGRYDEAKKVLQEGLAIKPTDIPLHLETANLCLIRNMPERAVDSYLRVIRLDPRNLEAALGLATALLASGRPIDAEATIREGLGRAKGERRAAFLLALAKALTARFDESSENDLLSRALQAIGEYRKIKPKTADSYFQEGIVQAKIGCYKKAHAAFSKCQQIDNSWLHAGVNASLVKIYIEEQRKGIRFLEIKSLAVFFIILIQIIFIWVLRLRGHEFVSETIIIVLVPICLGLMIVAFLMPSLAKFSVTGIAVELAEAPKPAEPKGPKGLLQIRETMPRSAS